MAIKRYFRWWATITMMLIGGFAAGMVWKSSAALVAAMGGAFIGSRFDPASKRWRNNIANERLKRHFGAGLISSVGYLYSGLDDEPKDIAKIFNGADLGEIPDWAVTEWFEFGQFNSSAFARALRGFSSHAVTHVPLLRIYSNVLIDASQMVYATKDRIVEKLSMLRRALDLPASHFEESSWVRNVDDGDKTLNVRRAAKLLAVRPTAQRDEIRSAYKRLVRQNHPDRLIARGASEEEIRIAGDRMHAIREAHDFLLAYQQ